MSKQLIICEKPSVAKDVAKALPGPFTRHPTHLESPDHLVTWAVGHLLGLAGPEVYDPALKTWAFEQLPIVPDSFVYVPRDKRARERLSEIGQLVQRADVTTVVNACDAGREGELIFKLIVDHLAVRQPVLRAWFSSMTPDAIRAAFGQLRPDAEMAGLEAAARARAESDWLVGMNATRAATTTVGGGRSTISLGRVQTPTLAIIVARDVEIERFVAETYWQVVADFDTADGGRYRGWWQNPDGGDRAATKDPAGIVAAAVRSVGKGRVVSVDSKPVEERPPQLFDLTSLQREANKRFGWTAKRTLAAAQAGYEEHKILTYPRTDSRHLTLDMVPQMTRIVSAVGAVSERLGPHVPVALATLQDPPARVFDDGKVTDHHGIVPTEVIPDASLSGDVAVLYDLVVARTFAALSTVSRSERTVVMTEAGGHLFRSVGTVELDAGWKAVERPADDDADDTDTDVGGRLPKVAAAQVVTVAGCDVSEGVTRPPRRLNEASLLGAMETAGRLVDDEEVAAALKDRGLGTPATRAATIERLIDVGYVERTGRQLKATVKGRAVIGVLGSEHVLARPDLTGAWEKALRDLESGVGDRGRFMAASRKLAAEVVGFFSGLGPEDLARARPAVAGCPRCEGRIIEGPKAFGCDSWKSREEPGCGFVVFKGSGRSKVTEAQLRSRIAENRSDGDPPPELGACPSTGCQGMVVERQRGWSCNSWRSKDEPGCGFVIWKEAGGKKLSTADAAKLLAAGKTNAAPRAPRDVLGRCPAPGCSGMIVAAASGKGWRCDSWRPAKSKRGKPGGCGTVFWARSRDGVLTREDVVAKLPTDSPPGP